MDRIAGGGTPAVAWAECLMDLLQTIRDTGGKIERQVADVVRQRHPPLRLVELIDSFKEFRTLTKTAKELAVAAASAIREQSGALDGQHPERLDDSTNRGALLHRLGMLDSLVGGLRGVEIEVEKQVASVIDIGIEQGAWCHAAASAGMVIEGSRSVGC